MRPPITLVGLRDVEVPDSLWGCLANTAWVWPWEHPAELTQRVRSGGRGQKVHEASRQAGKGRSRHKQEARARTQGVLMRLLNPNQEARGEKTSWQDQGCTPHICAPGDLSAWLLIYDRTSDLPNSLAGNDNLYTSNAALSAARI